MEGEKKLTRIHTKKIPKETLGIIYAIKNSIIL
jgi:hypothetical protein